MKHDDGKSHRDFISKKNQMARFLQKIICWFVMKTGRAMKMNSYFKIINRRTYCSIIFEVNDSH